MSVFEGESEKECVLKRDKDTDRDDDGEWMTESLSRKKKNRQV